MDSDDRTKKKTWLGVNRILDKDYFFYFLDLEVKRARRYQNFLSLMLLKLIRSSNSDNGGDLQICYQVLSDLLTVEML
jgi:hypothetical protein